MASALTLHIPLLPVGQGEYQPLLFAVLTLALIVIAPASARLRWIGVIFLGLAISALINSALGRFDSVSIIRCAMGPFFALSGAAFLRHIPSSALLFVIYFHAALAGLAVFFPDVVVSVLERLISRGTEYYAGWNSFFTNEPSYAALNLMGVLALYLLTGVNRLSFGLTLICASLFLATLSVTGAVFTVLLVVALVFEKVGVNLRGGSIIVGCVAGTLLVADLASDMSDSRLLSIANAFQDAIVEGDLMQLIRTEPSTTWRLLSNGVAAMGLLYSPLGTGGLNADHLLYEVASPVVNTAAGLVYANEVYQYSDSGLIAATPLFNFVTFGGVIAFLALLLALWKSLLGLVKTRLSPGAKTICLAYLLVGIFWQTALTSPMWWILVGATLGLSTLGPPETTRSPRQPSTFSSSDRR